MVSPVSGQIFERRLIEKYLAENGCDPTNQEPLTPEQLIAVKASPLVRPKAPSATSIPAILRSLQDEWDAVMLHSFTLRQQLQTARQELSHALYQHDAACRVIARLTKEVTAAREALATLKPQAGVPMTPSAVAAATPATPVSAEPLVPAAAASQQTMEATGMTEEILFKLQEKAKVLTGERKKRGKTVPEGLMTDEQISNFRTLASHPGLHSASIPGILSLDINANNTSMILTGGADKIATVFNKDDEQVKRVRHATGVRIIQYLYANILATVLVQLVQVIAILKGHTKKVNRVIYHPTSEDTVITASHDTTIRLWNVPTAQTLKLLRVHDGQVTGLSLHATGDYVLSTSLDKHWAFSDIRAGKLVAKVTDQAPGATAAELTCAQFHPDGLIFGTGTSDAVIKIWDLKGVSDYQEVSLNTSALACYVPVSTISLSNLRCFLPATKRSQLQRPQRADLRLVLLRERLLPGHGRGRRLCEIVGFAKAEELQDDPAGRALRGARSLLRPKWNLSRSGRLGRQDLPVQAVDGAQGLQRPHRNGHRRQIRKERNVRRLLQHGQDTEALWTLSSITAVSYCKCELYFYHECVSVLLTK